MKKFAVFSGFLGAGKTTCMMALTRHFAETRGKAAMISNDLGHGVSLADNRLAQLSGLNASEITDNCICYVNGQLADRLNGYYAQGCLLVVSDIPGFGVGALEHVYHGLTEKYPGQFSLAPFTVLAEPRTVELLRSGTGGSLQYIYDAQLKEADLIVLNKCDRLDAARRAADTAELRACYPEAEVLCISARTGEGLDALARALREGSASMRKPDIGYGGRACASAMKRISEYYIQYRAVVCCNDFDGTAYLRELGAAAAERIAAAGREIPHLKLLAWDAEGDYAKLDLIGTDRPMETTHAFTRPCTDIAVTLNASAACPYAELDALVTGAAEEVSARYQLEMTVFSKECFGMGEQA
jgi:Ni2+-binding GTPase involved in maturation of urease and hydrogenase